MQRLKWGLWFSMAWLCAVGAFAATRTWSGNSDTWTDANGTPWGGTAPTTNDVINLTQNTAANITVDYAANTTLGLTGTDQVDGTRFGNLTLSNSGGGTTTLQVASGDALPCGDTSSGRAYINAGGRLQVDGGLFSPRFNLYVTGGRIEQSGGLLAVQKDRYDFNLDSGTILCSGGTSVCRNIIMSGASVFDLGAGATLAKTWANTDWDLRGSSVFNVAGVTPAVVRWLDMTNTATVNWNRAGAQTFQYHRQVGGTFNLSNGTLTVSYQFDVAKSVGQTGTYNFAGGTIANGYLLKLGSEGGTGTFRHGANLTANFTDSGSGSLGGMWIGGTNGSGTYYLGDTNGTGVVATGSLNRNGLRVGPTGVLRGRGSFGASPYNAMQVSGKIIADGYGTNSDLDLSALGDHYSDVAALTNPVENVSDKGWFAIRGGKLKFPAVGTSFDANTYVKSANGSTYNVGESVYAADSVIDLVNSAQLAFSGLGSGNGVLTCALWAPDRTDLPTLPGSVVFLTVHDFTLTANTFTSCGVTIRYDDAAAGAREDYLRVWHYNGSTWDALPTTVDKVNKLVSVSGQSALGKFAVGYTLGRGTVVIVR
jgi:hypothetical protein